MTHQWRYYTACLLTAVFLSWGCSGFFGDDDEPPAEPLPEQPTLVHILTHADDEDSRRLSDQIMQACRYTRLSYHLDDLAPADRTQDTQSRPDSLLMDPLPASVRLVVLTTDVTNHLPDEAVQILTDFTARGGTIIVTKPVWDTRLNLLQGVVSTVNRQVDGNAKGWFFNKPVLPDIHQTEMSFSVMGNHNGWKRSEFKNDIEVIASAANDRTYPTILKNRVGFGQVYLFNTSIMPDKVYRGLIFSTMLNGLSGIPYRVANVSSIFLDDFPAPLYNAKLPPVDQEYDITHAEFVARVWWPEMQALADTFDLSYTAMTCLNYNVNVVPPFDFTEWTRGKVMIDGEQVDGSIWLAQQVANSRHELAFHGYNHVSLMADDWRQPDFMTAALQAVRKRWITDRLGDLPVTYVPPTNDIDSVGVQSLVKGLSSIRYLCSLYLGDKAYGGDREFGPDPYAEDLFDYPRITSGFQLDGAGVFSQESLYILTGIWTHFIHPDDVFQVNQRSEDQFSSRNELGLWWHAGPNHDKGLYEVFREHLTRNRQLHPLMRYKTVSDAVPEVRNWLDGRINRTREGSRLVSVPDAPSDTDSGPFYWHMYVPETHQKFILDAIERQAGQMHLNPLWDGVLVEFSTPGEFYIPYLAPETIWDRKQADQMAENVSRQLDALMTQAADDEDEDPIIPEVPWVDRRLEIAEARLQRSTRPDRMQEDQVIDLNIEFGLVSRAIDLLEERLLRENEWLDQDADRLSTYYQWESRASDAWPFLERRWTRYPTSETVALTDFFVDKIGTPDDTFEQKWFARRRALNPDDPALIAAYIQQSQDPDDWPQVKNHLRRLLHTAPPGDTLYNYALTRSLWYDPPESTLEWLAQFPSGADTQLQPLAGDIANLYAYSANDLNRALIWAEKDPDFDPHAKLDWMMEARQYADFIEFSRTYLTKQGWAMKDDEADSLRAYASRMLINEGYLEEGLTLGRPLVTKASPDTALLHFAAATLETLPVERQQTLLPAYGPYFTDSMRRRLETEKRLNSGAILQTYSSYESDNFNNSSFRQGVTYQWDRSSRGRYELQLERIDIRTGTDKSAGRFDLYSMTLGRHQSFDEGRRGLTISGGASFSAPGRSSAFRPLLGLQYFSAQTASFMDLALRFKPVLTNTSIQKNHRQLEGTVYREDFWQPWLETNFSGVGRWYTNRVWSYEATTRWISPVPVHHDSHLRPAIEISYVDATKTFGSGVPYWTADNLFIGGVGLGWRHQRPLWLFMIDPMFKRDNQTGSFFTTTILFEKTMHRFWRLRFQTDLSSSAVYRSNAFFFSLDHIFD